MTQLYNNTLAIEAAWLIEQSILSKPNYDALKNRGKIIQLRKGGNGRTALIEYASLPQRFKEKVIEKIGDPRENHKYRHFKGHLKPDKEAITFFGNYKLQDGRYLKTETAQEYCTNAMFLNALHATSNKTVAMRSASGGSKKGIWRDLTEIVNALKDEYKHTLPGNELRLKDRYKRYMSEGYTSLIHRNFGNNNSRKVNQALESLILSIYVMGNKPYANMVQDMYLEFLAGKADFVDVTTGEIFNRFDFYNDKGEPITISEATVWNYINDPKNRAIVDSKRNDSHSFNNMHRPHAHRHAPEYSLSKISLDDRDLPRKMHDGRRVKAYYAYDVTSTCLIGAAYSKNKDTALFIDCMRDMFRFLDKNNFGFPLEVEVEHHLVNQFKDDLMKAGVVFPFVRFCNPGNSQEKYAEQMNKSKKYGYEKRYQEGIGRFYSSLEANRPKIYKEWNERGMQVVEKKHEYEKLIADDLWIGVQYNNDLHPNQKKYPGMTRLDVLKAKINPNTAEFDPALVARYVGEKTSTTIRRNQYVTVRHGKYQLPKVEVLSKLKPNNYSVDAYYLPDAEGIVNEVYLYQNDEFIAMCQPLETFNRATAERTEKDENARTEQSKYISQFDKMIKDGRAKTKKLEIIENTDIEVKQPEIHVPEEEVIDWETYLEQDATIEERAINEF
jgi:hypothetical protein